MEQKRISELSVNDSFEGFLLIKNFSVKTGQTGKNYVDLTLADPFGEINGKVWNYTEEQFSSYSANKLVKVRAIVTQWNNTLQLKIERIRLANESDPVSIDDFVPSAPISAEKMMATLKEYISRIKKDDIRETVAAHRKE